MLPLEQAGMVEYVMQERLQEREREVIHQRLVRQAQVAHPQRARQAASYALLRCGRLLLRAGARLAEPRIA